MVTVVTLMPVPAPVRTMTQEAFDAANAARIAAEPVYTAQFNAAVAETNENAIVAAAAAAAAVPAAAEATASALAAVNAPGTSATSITSLAIQTVLPATVVLTIQPGKSLQLNMQLELCATASPENFMSGRIASYVSATGVLTMTINYARGLGTFAAWTVNLAPVVQSPISNAVRTLTSAYNITATDIGSAFACSGTFSVTTDPPATLGNAHYIYFDNSAGTGAVTIGTFVLQRGQAVLMMCDGAALRFVRFGGAFPTLKVSDRKASGVDGGTSVATTITQTRTFNTTDVNSIAGASLAADASSVPAGTYKIDGRAPASVSAGKHKAFLYNVTDGTYALIGSNAQPGGDSIISGVITIAAAKTFTVRHWTATAVAWGLGEAVGTGQVEVYSELIFEKVA